MTIHITPEPDFSYVSFESNVSAANYNDLISRVIKTFQPGKFVVTIFANKVSTPYTTKIKPILSAFDNILNSFIDIQSSYR